MTKSKSVGQYLMEASDVYPDNFIEHYFDFKTGKEIRGRNGDTLALFIGREIAELYDPRATDEENRAESVRALSTATRELAAVIAALSLGK